MSRVIICAKQQPLVQYQEISPGWTMLLTAALLLISVLLTRGNVVSRNMSLSVDQLRTDPDILEMYTHLFSEGPYQRYSRGIPDMKKDPCNRKI